MRRGICSHCLSFEKIAKLQFIFFYRKVVTQWIYNKCARCRALTMNETRERSQTSKCFEKWILNAKLWANTGFRIFDKNMLKGAFETTDCKHLVYKWENGEEKWPISTSEDPKSWSFLSLLAPKTPILTWVTEGRTRQLLALPCPRHCVRYILGDRTWTVHLR